DTVFSGVGAVAAKTGMIGTEENVKVIAASLKENKVSNYVLDPVMVCKGTDEALNPEINAATEKLLLPLATVVTPNIFETEQLSGIKINSREDMQNAAQILIKKGAKNVFIKGGAKLAAMENSNESCDLFYDGTEFHWLTKPLISTKWNHGAGCTTSAAIAAALALGKSPLEAVKIAKDFIQNSLSASFPLNEFVGPGNPSAWRGDKTFLNHHE
ncbi:MAG: hydroxymethylpyrimidine/phosphomethylpyrimidine kinase, partial [Spirochaetaceae bacterium]|nr:hydroxymethylpyrimidine/phosphomethylpyrimidine kinase [Spirochaetaceae bacterium]